MASQRPAKPKPLIERDGTDESAGELLISVPMRFNRLLLLRP